MASPSPRLYSSTYVQFRERIPLLFHIFRGAKTNGDCFLAGQLFAPIVFLCASLAVQFINGVPTVSRQEVILIEEAVRWLRPHGISLPNEADEEEFFDQLFNLVCNWTTFYLNSLETIPAFLSEESILADWEANGAPDIALQFMFPAYTACNRQILNVVKEYVFDPAGDLVHQHNVFHLGFVRFLELNGPTHMRFVSSECWPRHPLLDVPHQDLNEYLYEFPDRQLHEDIDARMLRYHRRKYPRMSPELLPDETPVEFRPAHLPIPLMAFVKAHNILLSPASCGICLLDLTAEECKSGLVVSTRCEHLYHGLCLHRWVNESAMGMSNKCPTCREIMCPRRMRRHGNIVVA